MTKLCAWNLTRKEAHYRHEAFSAGLRAAGYEVKSGLPPNDINPGDVVLGWNRYAFVHDTATRIEKSGGIYLSAENGYLGPGGVSPHAMNPRQWFALGVGYHNDSTVIDAGGPKRFDALGVELKPWRNDDGGHVLVCPNRSFGVPGRVMPPDWANDVCRRLQKVTSREIRLRPHPGNEQPQKPLSDDLSGALCTVIWSSSAGVHSLVAGIPVICEAPYWICKEATFPLDICGIGYEKVFCNDFHEFRQMAMERMAWGQWSLAEIESGEAFDRVLRGKTQTQVAAVA